MIKEKRHILDYEPEHLRKIMTEIGESSYRAGQIVKWAYEKKASDFSDFSDLSEGLRAKLKEGFVLRTLETAGRKASKLDGTVKFDFKTDDGNIISAVFLPNAERNSVCVSTQAGCGIGCTFCATGAMGFKRDLRRGEIIEQVLRIENEMRCKVSGILLMGMGEPLANYNNTISALKAFTDPKAFGIGRRHIILSTSGLVPLIKRFSEEDLGIRLALSLHSADDKIRARLVPYKKVPYSVAQILDACLAYTRKTNSKLTIEYILISGVNDSKEDAETLAQAIRMRKQQGDQIQVNLIPYNKTENRKYSGIKDEDAEKFKAWLDDKKVFALIRQPRGADIGAACGQLGV